MLFQSLVPILLENVQLKGRQLEVLFEGTSKREGQLTGRTGTNKVVNVSCDNNKIGDLVKVTIKDGFMNSLRA